MHLIAPLLCGVSGASDGHATIKVHQTTQDATYFTTFEGDVTATGPVTLDANGGASIYVNQLVTVSVYSSTGALVRSWTDGANASNVEVRSNSFSGTSYQDAAGNVVAAVNQPTTLQAILDRVLTSFGSTDFNWLDGDDVTIRPLRSALIAMYDMFVNVKDPVFGALGDGSTDDLDAILAAFGEASNRGGGIVFFPPGTYAISGASLSIPTGVSIMGSGASTTILQLTGTGVGFQFADDASANLTRNVSDVTIMREASTLSDMMRPGDNNDLHFERCVFGSTVATYGPLYDTFLASDAFVAFNDCVFLWNNTGTDNMITVNDASCLLSMVGCRITSANAAYTGIAIQTVGPARLSGSLFIAPANATRWLHRVAATVGCAVDSCLFSGGLSAIGQASSTGRLVESNNIFIDGVSPYDYTNLDRNIDLGSRSQRHGILEDDSSSIVLTGVTSPQHLGSIKLVRTTTTSAAISGNIAYPGSDFYLSIYRDGGGGNVTYTFGSGFLVNGAPYSLADNTVTIFHFKALQTTGSQVWILASTPIEEVPEV